jgi:hypothetical protein
MVVIRSSVMESVATPPTSRSAETRMAAFVPHQKALRQRFLPGWMTR